MDLKTGSLLVAPAVKNSSCSHPRYSGHNFIAHIGIAETIEAVLILVLTLGVIGANCLVIFVINNRRYAAYIHQQPRYLLTSLALNDLTIGLLITPFGLMPALFHCWPYGEIFCQIQALLRGALSQQSAVILVCMAVDRYMCALHPRRYYQHSSKKGCVAILSLTWIISLTVFGFLVLPKGYYFNNTGLMACEPFYSKPSYRILSTCALYFPTTMVLMYCYGSSFHMSRFRLNDPTMPLTAAAHHPHPHPHPTAAQQLQMHQQHQQHQHHQQQHHQQAGMHSHLYHGHSHHPHHQGHPNHPHHHGPPVMGHLSMAMSMGLAGMPNMTNKITKKIVPIQEKNSSGSTSRSMAAISLGFIVMVTPWTIQEIVTACTGSKLPPFLDFLVTWTALSNSLWNPFMYWLLNSDFRRLSRQLMPNKCFPHEDTPEHKSGCCHINANDFEITTLPIPPEPPSSRPPAGGGGGSSSGGGGAASSGGGVASSIGGSVLGICARSRANSLSRSASQYIRGTMGGGMHNHQAAEAFSTTRPDIEGLSEKYWGEILERTVSSGNLNAMQKNLPPHLPYTHHLVHQLHQPQQHHQQQTTSFSKASDLQLNLNLSQAATAAELGKFSNSEPKLCEHLFHDVNCAKSKAANGGGALDGESSGKLSCGRSIPDI
ncbi:5-hydroxytryptamine receptor 1A [Drosophila eugracilis]|uniref:5-hydroxytryptamine receptor 1A n=1 Tax=Drosophila eugracilis TaxID=29029 RepID=UPI001BDA5044|nr:5-hydroxytryptamine receptor 1A [Drosophila eugracilis]